MKESQRVSESQNITVSFGGKMLTDRRMDRKPEAGTTTMHLEVTIIHITRYPETTNVRVIKKIIFLQDTKTEVFPFKNNPKNLDPSYETDLDF